MSREELLLLLSLSFLAVVGGLAIAFSAVKRVETAIDLEIPGAVHKQKSKKGKKGAGKSATTYQEIPETPVHALDKASPSVPGIHGIAGGMDYRDVLKDKMGRVKVSIDGKDYTNALACLQEMIMIAEKNGDTRLADNYKIKFEEILKLSVE